MSKHKIIGREKITREIIEREINSEYDGEYRNIVVRAKPKLNNGDFITLFQGVMLELSKAELTKGEFRMLFYLIGTAQQGNAICIDLKTLSECLGEKKSNVCQTLNSLVKKNIIIKATRQGARIKGETNIYELSLNFDRLNYNLAYKGKIKDYKHLQHRDPKIELKSLPTNHDVNQLQIPFFGDFFPPAPQPQNPQKQNKE